MATNISSSPLDDNKIACIPSRLLKNIRTTAALRSYDLLFSDKSMNSATQQHKVQLYFHGDQEHNIMSQIDLLMKSYGLYNLLFDKRLR